MSVAPTPNSTEQACMYLPASLFKQEKATYKRALFHNVCNVLGYFPLINIISGIARAIFYAFHSKFIVDKSYLNAEIARGLLETLVLPGPLFAVFDFVNSNRFGIKFKDLY